MEEGAAPPHQGIRVVEVVGYIPLDQEWFVVDPPPLDSNHCGDLGGTSESGVRVPARGVGGESI